MQAIDDFIQALSKLDCGSNSCEFAQNKSGQRSNSGCQCLGGYRDRVKIPVIQLWRALKNKFTDTPIKFEVEHDKIPDTINPNIHQFKSEPYEK